MLGALHLANNKDFDMDELFQYLVEEDKSTVCASYTFCSHELTTVGAHPRSIIFS